MKPKYRIGLLISILLSVLLLVVTTSASRAQSPRKQVLVIHSYHIGYKWTDDLMLGIRNVFQDEGNVDLRVEYFDTKRISDEEYIKLIVELFKKKYQNTGIDLVLSTDDAALNFLLDYADELFPKTPVAFAGANYFDETRLVGHDQFTGISEEADLSGTLDTALAIHPNVNRVIVVNDQTTTGQIVRNELNTITLGYPEITFEFIEGLTMPEIQAYLSSLPSDTLVLLTIFFRDSADSFFEYDLFSPLIAQSSAVPVYATWDFSFGFGVVGGKLTSGFTTGQNLAKLGLKILAGTDPSSIPVDRTVQSGLIFDYSVLEKFGIPLSAIPENSEVVGRPVSFFQANRNLILMSIAGFVILGFVIVFLGISNNQRRIAQTKLGQSNLELQEIQTSLEQQVVDRTRALETSTQVSRRLSTILDPNQLVRQVVEQLQTAFGFYHAHIYLYDEGKQNLEMRGGTGEAGQAMLASGHKIIKGQGLVGRAAETNETILIPDVAEEKSWLPNPLLPDTRAEIAVPIAIGHDVLGVLDVQHNIAAGLTETEASLIQSIADQVAVAIQNARAYTRAQRQAVREAQIAAINQRVQSATSIDDVLKVAVTELGRTLGSKSSVELRAVRESTSHE